MARTTVALAAGPAVALVYSIVAVESDMLRFDSWAFVAVSATVGGLTTFVLSDGRGWRFKPYVIPLSSLLLSCWVASIGTILWLLVRYTPD